jgi:hypothetical protein
MRVRQKLVLALCLGVLSYSAVRPLDVQAGEPSSIYMQELIAAKASEKVAAVLWTRRADRYTLQVIFPKMSAVSFFVPVQDHSAVRLWLLSADGSAIPAARSPALGADEKLSKSAEITYSVSLSAGRQAVAAVLKIDDEYFVDPIAPLPDM